MKFSIITASVNSARTIGACLASVDAQSFGDWEHLLVDGASIDGTLESIRARPDPRRHLVSEPDSGIYDAWNKGIRRAKGDYLLFLNSDDELFDRDVLRDLASTLDKKGNPSIVHGHLLAVEPQSGYSYLDGRPANLESFLYRMDFCTLASLVRRDVFERVGGYDERYAISADYDWAIRLFRGLPPSDIVFVDRVITRFCLGGRSNTSQDRAYQEIDEIVSRHFPAKSLARYRRHAARLRTIRRALPLARRTGLLWLWRQWKVRCGPGAA